jgi:hypothetical protein
MRLKADLDRAQQELASLHEEVRIKDARMAMINPQRRPHYPPTQRLAILELKAARGWSLEQTARVFPRSADMFTAEVDFLARETQPQIGQRTAS